MSEVPVFRPAPHPDARGKDAVPKEYAHLSRDSALLVTGWRRREDGVFSLTVRWPAPEGEMPYDPRVLTQTVRQTGLVIAHAEYGVPLSHQTLLHSFDFTVVPGFRVPSDEPAALTVEIALAEPKKRGRAVGSLGMDIRLFHDTVMVARADCDFGWISPAVFRRLRGEHPTAGWNTWELPDPIDPRAVGRVTAHDVVLAPGDGPHHWQLRNDVDNVLLYDHPVDHVPGLVLMEAAHQAANAFLHPSPFDMTAFSSSFERYVEFDRPCWITAEAVSGPGRTTVLVTGTQDGDPVFRGRLTGSVTGHRDDDGHAAPAPSH
ncbi:ScbA/BarX family gamma-butyrolactone biosynthesis protein [Streptomyces halstedii]|uniref:ScbA/BarX family gamma-butyrolactone biosynthesis protein n=1 Tax=Streptomyces TaxID=1883 RepID=UPI0004A9A2A4|nr:ScbA/BarX family gamma-butyrolactone biosynthesis protein [Streptomyces sp. NTK 937]KDQ68213.1 A-factor biosynthesis protein [Streptomyces sp. NTK 937]